MRKLVDKLHKVAVGSLMGITVVGTVVFGFQVYEFLKLQRRRKNLATENIKTSGITGLFSEFSMAVNRRFLGLFQSAKLLAYTGSYRSASDKKSWNILKVNHIAVASKDLGKSVTFYKDILGAKTSEPVPMPEHGVTTVFVELLNTKIELLLPLGNESPIENFLMKNPAGGMHHICLEVDNIETAVEDLKTRNIRLLSDKPKIGAHGKPVIFLHPKDCGGVLIELEQV